mmetsp:Transcript_30923/g.40838  ORF Transcript_30923/g.40838 Transcript_30923/m.40838 type:complete len:719 (-) Transcript_30923:201-2357(-)
MSFLSKVAFQGISVDISSFDGLKLNFHNGNLVLECANFSGKIVLTPDKKDDPEDSNKNKVESQKKENSKPSTASASKETTLSSRKSPSKKVGPGSAKKPSVPAAAKPKAEPKLPGQSTTKKGGAAPIGGTTKGGRKTTAKSAQKTQKNSKVAEKRKRRDSISSDSDSEEDDIPVQSLKSPRPTKKNEVKSASKKTPAKDEKQTKKSPRPSPKKKVKTETTPKVPSSSEKKTITPAGKKKAAAAAEKKRPPASADKKKSQATKKTPNKKTRAPNAPPSSAEKKNNGPTSASKSKKQPAKQVDERPKIALKAKAKAKSKSAAADTPSKLQRSQSMPVQRVTPLNSSPPSSGSKRSLRHSSAGQEIEPLPSVERPKSRTCQLPISMGQTPHGRWAHSLTAISPTKLVLYGGEPDEDFSDYSFGDLHIYCLEKNTWERPVNGDGQARQWHSATFLPDKNLLVVFGGETVSESGKPKTLNDIMVLDTDICLWYPPSIAGKCPEPRAGHTASLVGKYLVIFGGSTGRKWLNSVSCMDTERWTWDDKINIKGTPPRGRSYHSATVVGNKIVIYGGSNYKSCFEDLVVLDMAGGDWQWFYPLTVGDIKPGKRTGHSATLLADQKTILFYGGWDPVSLGSEQDIVYFKDSFLLDTELWEWLPGPEIASGNGASNHNEIGEAEENLLRYRTGHSAILLPNENSSEIIFYGGQSQDGTRYSDLRLLTIL